MKIYLIPQVGQSTKSHKLSLLERASLKLVNLLVGFPDTGIYQTVHVAPGTEGTLNMQGLIRSTRLTGDPWRYVVQIRP
jgi:hypothetical protein